MSAKSLVAVWRDAIRETKLDSTAKLVAHTLATWANGSGLCYPSRESIARGASLSVRAVERAIVRLEATGALQLERSLGRSTHRYALTLPPTASDVRRSEWETASQVRRSRKVNGERQSPNGEPESPNGVRRSPKSAESAESAAAPPLAGAPLIEDNCAWCGGTFVGEPDDAFCSPDCEEAAINA